MGELEILRWVLGGWVLAAGGVFVVLLGRAAPYGRHAEGDGGRAIPARRAWTWMELPTVTLVPILYATGRHAGEPLATLVLVLWLLHYVDRTLVYPFRLPAAARPVPVGIVVGAFVFQLVNGTLIGRWQFELAPSPAAPFLEPRVWAGVALFGVGFAINRWADAELARLRRGAAGYVLPQRGLYRRISCPNYLGEIVLWIGFAIVAATPPAAAFALWTVANLAPRARSHHRWYRERFPEATQGRRALVPGLW